MRLTAIALLAAVCAAASSQAGTIFESTDPMSPPLGSGGLTLTNVPDPVLPGTAGEASGFSQKFTSVTTPNVPLPASAIGNPFSVSVDYLIPSNSTLSAASQIYLQINIDGANRGSIGFASVGSLPRDEWLTLTRTDLNFPGGDPTNGPNIPAGATEISGSLITVIDGFGGSPTFPLPGGETLLVDNFRIEVVTIPEPTALALVGLGLLAAARRR